MVGFGHTAVGATVGLITYSYLASDKDLEGLVIAGAAGVISHYITDFIPHGHFVAWNKVKECQRKNGYDSSGICGKSGIASKLLR